MRERPILFSAPMVRAILDGRKTVTRRLMKPTPHKVDGGVPFSDAPAWAHAEPGSAVMRCPYGVRGDRLWVRETHAIVPRTAYAWSNGVEQVIRPDDDHDAAIFRAGWDRSSSGFSWRPSIHMPRWASRITLEVTGVRVQRLCDISESDAISEGVRQLRDGSECLVGREGPGSLVTPWPTARDAFRDLWQSINGLGSWGSNPWVWVVEFKRVGQ